MGIHDQAAEDDSTEPPDEPESHQPKEKTRRASYLWAMLIARIYEALPLLCPRCGNPMKIVAFITDPASLSRILTIANQVPQKPRPLQPARAPPQQDFEFTDTEPTWP
jgi:hypothetical protein